jgi:hypothetical protein
VSRRISGEAGPNGSVLSHRVDVETVISPTRADDGDLPARHYADPKAVSGRAASGQPRALLSAAVRIPPALSLGQACDESHAHDRVRRVFCSLSLDVLPMEELAQPPGRAFVLTARASVVL